MNNNWVEVIGVMAAIIGLLIFAFKLLLKDWFNKSSEIESLKKTNNDTALNRFENDIKSFRSAINIIEGTIKTHGSKLEGSELKFVALTDKLNETIKMVEDFQISSSDKIRNMIKSELVELSKRAAMIRNKKDSP